MRDKLEAHAAMLGRRRVAAVRRAILAMDLPAGLRAEASGEDVVIAGTGLAAAIAFDPRLRAIGGGDRP